MKIIPSKSVPKTTPCLVVPISGKRKSPTYDAVNKALKRLPDTLIGSSDISTKLGSVYTQAVFDTKYDRVMFVGTGDDALSIEDVRKVLTKAIGAVMALPVEECYIATDLLTTSTNGAATVAFEVSKISTMMEYKYTATLSKDDKDEDDKVLTTITLPVVSTACKGKAVANGINLAKELGNLPANICDPTYLSDICVDIDHDSVNLVTRVYDEAYMVKNKMGAMLSVTAGTTNPGKLIVMEFNGGKISDAPHVLVGKGVTFDSGGISLKPGGGMADMKFDMGGAAAVIGAMKAIAEMQPKINVVAVIGAVENMPAGNATKPGDVITSMKGKTIEIDNTDAEGRLVLCDCLHYAIENYKPASIIDVATLTGACVVALGAHATALYCNDDDMANDLLGAAESTHDRAWRMPLWKDYTKQLKSKVADINNCATGGGGSITAACFLQEFVGEAKWAHLDIAGVAWKAKMSTGRPVSLLVEYLLTQEK